jgi:hypothetical protein
MKKMFAVFTLVMALLTLNFVTNAEAIVVKLPSGGGCPNNLPAGTKCVGSYNLTDMGQFENSGLGDWIPNQQFMNTMAISNFDRIPTTAPVLWSLGPNWLNMITPTKSKIVTGRFDRRVYAPDTGNQDDMRIAFKTPIATEHVNLYLSECFAPTPDTGVEVSTTCGDHGTPVNPNVTRVAMFAMNKTGDVSTIDPLKTPKTALPGTANTTLADIDSVKWVERNLIGTPVVNDIMKYATISYNLTARFWNDPPSTPSALIQDTDIHYKWTPIPADLTEGEIATFEIKLKNIPDPIFAYTVIKSLDAMPIVLTTYKSTEYNILKEQDKKSGKMVIKAEEVEVTINNITVREVPDLDGFGPALVIQWPEPDLALFGGRYLPANSEYQVRVWVGASKTVGVDFYETFYFYDIPAQAGTCVVSGYAYTKLMELLQADGYATSDLRARLFYREHHSPNGMPAIPGKFALGYQNRSQTNFVPINE